MTYSPGNEEDDLDLGSKFGDKKSLTDRSQEKSDRKSERKEKIEKRFGEKHFLQVILQLSNGKPLVLLFKGMILAPNEGLLALKKTEYFLPNVPIGLLTPVMFPIEMTNVGSVSVSYNVDIVEDKTKAGSSTTLSKFKIFEVHNSQGTVNQGERNYLFCKFRPLESITYKFLLKLKMFDMFKTIDTVDIKVEGCGFLSHIQKPQKELTEKIPMQRSSGSLFGSQVFFSIEELDFGEILPGTSEHRIIILYNISPNRKLSFKIKETKLPW